MIHLKIGAFLPSDNCSPPRPRLARNDAAKDRTFHPYTPFDDNENSPRGAADLADDRGNIIHICPLCDCRWYHCDGNSWSIGRSWKGARRVTATSQLPSEYGKTVRVYQQWRPPRKDQDCTTSAQGHIHWRQGPTHHLGHPNRRGWLHQDCVTGQSR